MKCLGRIDKNKQKKEEQKKTNCMIIKEWVSIMVTAIIIAAIAVQFIRPTRVDGLSMYSTLNDRDYLIINTMKYKVSNPKRGEIIIFDTDMPIDGFSDLSIETRGIIRRAVDFILHDDSRGKDLVKRVIGVEGDHIQIENGTVKINGKEIYEPYLDEGIVTEGNIDITVPKNKLFVMGDNRVNSLDSRSQEVGLVDKKDVMGHVMLRLLPVSDFGSVD
ncbi:signal peptidase I [Peptacetobacter sp.]|uniref:signal peptidase I n=1 Tax=Peptacetobacter sp. TaxID=2991975 RepID=UPI002FE6E061